jgi:glyoxylase-like metal-dependent hydrolase (beta-lactamase superfamily II)
MAAASELQHLCPGLVIWNAYDSAIKTELFSAALLTGAGVYLVDPIQLTDPASTELKALGTVCGIVVTNNNHQRAALAYAASFNVPILAHRNSFRDSNSFHLTTLKDDETMPGDLRVIAIQGAVPGEIVLYYATNGGTLVVGDALINFAPYGFTFLPEKYCQNARKMRRSLSQLLKFPAERLIFAHGTPIISGATERIRRLLDGNH